MSTVIHKFGVKSVGGSQSTVTVTFASDEEAGTPAAFPGGATVSAVGIPNWATSIRITSISTTAVTFTFGTQTGSGGGTLYWHADGR